MKIVSRYRDEIEQDRVKLGMSEKEFDDMLAHAHANVNDPVVVEALETDLRNFRKYKFYFRKGKRRLWCRYIFGYYKNAKLFKDDVIIPVWISERSALDQRYHPVKKRLGILPADN